MGFYLYRARVVAFPDGSHRTHKYLGDDFLVPNEDWEPTGWDPDPEYVERFKTRKFVWPKSGREYKSRSSAKRRVELLEFYGATAVIERSTRIEWPEEV